MQPGKRVCLGRGANSGQKFTYVVPLPKSVGLLSGADAPRIHRIIAGSKRGNYRPALNSEMSKGGTGGTRGTADLIFKGNGVAEIRGEVASGHWNKGIGTDLLVAAEKVACANGARVIEAVTDNPAGARILEKAGWKVTRLGDAWSAFKALKA